MVLRRLPEQARLHPVVSSHTGINQHSHTHTIMEGISESQATQLHYQLENFAIPRNFTMPHTHCFALFCFSAHIVLMVRISTGPFSLFSACLAEV